MEMAFLSRIGNVEHIAGRWGRERAHVRNCKRLQIGDRRNRHPFLFATAATIGLAFALLQSRSRECALADRSTIDPQHFEYCFPMVLMRLPQRSRVGRNADMKAAPKQQEIKITDIKEFQ